MLLLVSLIVLKVTSVLTEITYPRLRGYFSSVSAICSDFTGYKNDNFSIKEIDVFHIFTHNIDCGYTLDSCTLDREIRCFTLCKKFVILHKLSYTGPTSCYLTLVVLGRHVISSLSDVTKRQNDVSFIQDGGLKCRVLKGKMDLF